MKKIALVFVVAVLAPSLVLAWLALRSLRDQQFILERQQSLLYQGVADSLAREIAEKLAEQQRDFSAHVETLLANKEPRALASGFDADLRRHWPTAEVGFCVTLSGNILSPSPASSPEARFFCLDNGGFLGNREVAEVYWNNAYQGKNPNDTRNAASVLNSSQAQLQNVFPNRQQEITTNLSGQNSFASGKAQSRKVNPVNQALNVAPNELPVEPQSLSKVTPAEAEFRQLIGDATDGILARFLQNKLKIMFWHRPQRDPQLVFGAQLDLPRVIGGLRNLVQVEPAFRDEISVALLDDNAKPVALTPPGFRANWKRPFVASEIGEALPHWEAAVYLINPAKLTQSVQTARLTLGLLIAMLVLAIGVGSWLIVNDLNRQLTLARQKTDFVSNVSHELKTPLTSIRMFSELLAEGRVTEPAKQTSYLKIITAEAARLTRLINNVLDFSRLERGEKKYNFQRCDLAEVARNAAQTFRPHLEANNFEFDCALPGAAIPVHGDPDALSQVIVNFLSNAEKYSNGAREITLEVSRKDTPLPYAEIKVLDRGPGVPRGCEEKIFEKFYRAHDSLSSGIQGSGLGLTLARQIAKAHGGDVVYEPREGGGSCFSLRLPIKPI